MHLVLFGYLSGITQRLEFVTGILILPQRQTVLVAKQAAAVDVLSNGRLRLGVGVGWNDVEYEALGQDFGNRGRRSEEQIEVMRALWTQEIVNFEGRWHKITDAGINPLPVQRPIPIWIGGGPGSVGSTADAGVGCARALLRDALAQMARPGAGSQRRHHRAASHTTRKPPRCAATLPTSTSWQSTCRQPARIRSTGIGATTRSMKLHKKPVCTQPIEEPEHMRDMAI